MDRMILLAFTNRKLIHDATLDANVLIFDLLANDDEFHAIERQRKEMVYQNTRHHLDGCGGGEPGPIWNITVKQNIHSFGDGCASLTNIVDHPFREVRPFISLLIG